MKLNLSRWMILVAGALVLGSAAFAQELNAQAKVPFDFVLGNNVYPAGEYAVQNANPDNHLLRLRNIASSESVLVVFQPTSLAVEAKQTQLVFHRVGNTYFLYRIRAVGSTLCREFQRSHAENQMVRNTDRETVIIAAKLIH